MIARRKLYCDYWRNRFLTDSPEKICTKINHDRAGSCYILASFPPEAKAIKIASMKLYCDYWRNRFLINLPEKICTKIKHDRAGSCYVLASFHPEDKAIHLELKNKHVAWTLEQQAREREEKRLQTWMLDVPTGNSLHQSRLPNSSADSA